MLYHMHEWHKAAMLPFRYAAQATQATLNHPLFAGTANPFSSTMKAGAEMLERSTRQFSKPIFDLATTKIGKKIVTVEEEIIFEKPFCHLRHFKRDTNAKDPRILIVAPMSGHHSTLLRGTVEALLPDHDVYITDWIDAKLVPQSKGPFDLEDYITYVMEFCRFLGADIHLLAVCQPAPAVLAAVALMAEMKDPCQPRSMTLMGGPIDTDVSRTAVTDVAHKHSLEWFRHTVIHHIPFYYPGAHRLVYPGFIQLQGFISMNLERHVGEHVKLFQNLVKGDEDSATSHRKFYDEYLSVIDTTAEFYLQTIERIFQKNDLAKGTFTWHGQLVKPSSIEKTALLVVEGELDDISAPGQTLAALDLCSGLAPDMKKAHLQKGVGHYGIFNGRKWREHILPVLHEFIIAHETPVKKQSHAHAAP